MYVCVPTRYVTAAKEKTALNSRRVDNIERFEMGKGII